MSRSQSPSKRSSSKLKNAPPISVIVLLVAFILLAFGFIAFRQLHNAQERRLRLLAGFSERIESTVEDLTDRFVRVVAVEEPPEETEPNETPSNDDTDGPPDGGNKRENAPPQATREAVRAYLDNVPHLALVESFPRPQTCTAGESTDGNTATTDHAARRGLIALTAASRFAYLHYCPPAPEPSPSEEDGPGSTGGDGRRVYRAHIDLRELIAPMIFPGVFDSVILADLRGEILLQEGEPELRMVDLAAVLEAGDDDSKDGFRSLDRLRSLAVEHLSSDERASLEPLLHRAESDAGSPSLAAGIGMQRVEIANQDYYAFLQPVQPGIIPPRRHRSGEPARWIAVGLISSENLLSSGLTTSPVMLFVLISILPLALVSWPFLKLALISRRQRFNRLDLASLLFATVVGISLGVLLLFDLLFVARLQVTVDDQLERLGRTISTQLLEEVEDAYGQLLDIDLALRPKEPDQGLELSSPPPAVDSGFCRPGGREDGSETADIQTIDHLKPVQSITRSAIAEAKDPSKQYLTQRVAALLRQPNLELATYPIFDSVFWATPYGHHACATIPLRRHAILPSNVEDRAYFRCASRCEPEPYFLHIGPVKWRSVDWPCADERNHGPSKPGTLPVCLDSVLDRTTGESVAVLAIPTPGPAERREVFPVTAMVTRFASVAHPVLPSEFGFAIVEPSGRVLFHSDSRRELTENFLKASDEDPLLESLLHERREGHRTISYWGQRSRAHVLPLEGVPWSLVTFRSLQDLRVRNFELIYDFLNPYVLFLGFYGVVVGWLLWRGRRSPRISLWPSSRNLPVYWRIVWAAPVVILVLMVLMVWTDRPHWVLWASFLAPAPLLAVMAWRHKEQKGTGGANLFADNALTREWRRLRERQPRWAPKWFRLLLALVFGGLIGLGSPIEATLLAALAIASAAAALWWRLEFEGTRRKTAYILALGSLLTVLALLPALGFFSLARARQLQLLTQQTQVELARRIEERQVELHDRQKMLPELLSRDPEHDGDTEEETEPDEEPDLYYNDKLTKLRDAYLHTVFDTWTPDEDGASSSWAGFESSSEPPWHFALNEKGHASWMSSLSRWPERALSNRLLPLNTLSARPVRADLSRYGFETGSWTWDGDQSLALELPSLLGTGPPLRLGSVMPETGTLSDLPLLHRILFLLGLLALAASPALLARFIAREVLLVDLIGAPGEKPSSRSQTVSPGTPGQPERMSQPIAVILRDANDTSEVIRRVVLVSTLPDRGAWTNMLADDPTEPIIEKEPGATKGRAQYVETSFAMCWREILEDTQDADAMEAASDEDTGAKAEEGQETELPPTPRSERFARLLAPDAPPEDPDQRERWKPRPLLLLDFEPELEKEGDAADQIAALKRLINSEERSVVILSEQILDLGLGESAGRIARGSTTARGRWIEFLGTFSVQYGQDYRVAPLANRAERLLKQVHAMAGAYLRAEHRHTVRRIEKIVRLVAEECAATPVLRRIGYDLLDEIDSVLREATETGANTEEPETDDPGGDRSAWNLLELITREYVIVKVGTEARLHYRHLWNQCTRDEKLVLVQLVEHGIVNPKYLGWVSDLMNRGLIARCPALRPMNESFARFVHQEVQRSEILEWIEEGGPSGWNVLKWILPIPLVGLAAFLFITQQDALSSLTGLVVAAASLAPFVINLYNKVQELPLHGDRDRSSSD